MRLATVISLGASAVLGLGALVAAKFWLPSADKEAKKVEMASVVVAAKPIPFGAKLDAKNLAVVQMPVASAPVGSYRTIAEVTKLDGGAPVTLTAFTVREPLLPTKLSGAGARPSMAAMISPGMRAYTIKVSDVAAGGGHILPGDRVDIMMAREIPGEVDQEVEATVVLQNVRVLGINMNADQTSSEKANPKTATMEVTVEDAGRLSVASEVGELSLALRRTGAVEIEPIRAIEVSDLRPFGAPLRVTRRMAPPPPPSADAAPRPAAPATPRPRTGGLVIVNGDQRSTPASSGAGA
jgi:pilus assembly protein CpaB